ncbi:MAG: alpha-hydroxy-acid oxidizing protein [Desulfovibrio sp.]|jgi:isopentenyl diphosphate isomerase/L-lactate dehydrogenase-like FMN-dependent dehydrogenase|nr:alpha-hydroxy-acid oxidizing protein [Desulfovibrio sp.]
MADYREKARERMAKCQVCPVCNGKACAGQIPGMGGIGSGMSFMNNLTALAAWRVLPRCLHGADSPDPTAGLWGQKLSLPVLAAPIGDVIANVGSDMQTNRYTELLVKGCREAGTVATFGDNTRLEALARNFDKIGDYGAMTIPFFKPWSPPDLVARLDMAAGHGCAACGVDVDAAGFPVFRKASPAYGVRSAGDMARIAEMAHARGLKFIVKGVMAVSDAVIAAESGADALIVSNHGGRSIDCAPGTAEVLPGIAAAVGHRILVMADGGVRTGLDVVRMLALGAKLVLVCRPVAIALHGDEDNGVREYFADLRNQLVNAMRLTGCPDLAAITREVIC